MGTDGRFAAAVVRSLDYGETLQRVQLGSSQPTQKRRLFVFGEQEPGTTFADVLQDLDSRLEESNVEDGKGQLDVPKMAGAVGQFAPAGLADGRLVRGALDPLLDSSNEDDYQTPIKDAVRHGRAFRDGVELAIDHLDLGHLIDELGLEDAKVDVLSTRHCHQ